MTLWNIIRDFFVQYIFGGVASNGNNYNGNIFGDIYYVGVDNDAVDNIFTGDSTYAFIKIGSGIYPDNLNGDNAGINLNLYLSLGDWLSTTATIITLCAICVFLFFFVRWLFRLTAGLISGRG